MVTSQPFVEIYLSSIARLYGSEVRYLCAFARLFGKMQSNSAECTAEAYYAISRSTVFSKQTR